MKLNSLCAYLPSILGLELHEVTEALRGLKEGTRQFLPRPGMLDARPGPGGGVDADAERSALLLLGIMTGAPRKAVPEAAWRVWHIQTGASGWVGDGIERGEPCPRTGALMLGQAVVAILADRDIANDVSDITIGTDDRARIEWSDGEVSDFGNPATRPKLVRSCSVSGDVLASIAALIAPRGNGTP